MASHSKADPNTGTTIPYAKTPEEVQALKEFRRKRKLAQMKANRDGDRKPQPDCGRPTKAGGICTARIAVVEIRGKKYQLKTCVMHSSPAIRKELGLLNTDPRANPGAGRKPKPTAMSILRARFEENADRYLQPLEDAITALKAHVVGNGGSAHLEFTPDIALQLKAMETMIDRIYGRPKQVTELTGFEGGPVEVQVPNDEERARGLAAILASTGALNTVLTPSIPQNASASAPTTN